jgi:NDP-sugar pyrophosphorylase family protein
MLIVSKSFFVIPRELSPNNVVAWNWFPANSWWVQFDSLRAGIVEDPHMSRKVETLSPVESIAAGNTAVEENTVAGNTAVVGNTAVDENTVVGNTAGAGNTVVEENTVVGNTVVVENTVVGNTVVGNPVVRDMCFCFLSCNRKIEVIPSFPVRRAFPLPSRPAVHSTSPADITLNDKLNLIPEMCPDTLP